MATENRLKVLSMCLGYLTTIGDGNLTEWEQTFLASLDERYDKYADDVVISDKQFASLERILKKYEDDR